MGMELAGFENMLCVENNPTICKTLKKNRPHWSIVNSDIKDVTFLDTPTDAVFGGPPCQAFSHAGKRLGFKDIRGTAFFEFARAVKEIQPKIFLAENVKGLMTHDKGRTIETILSVFNEIGYDITPYSLDAYNYGVPQRRVRTVIIGIRKDLDIPFWPPVEILSKRTLRDALEDVPESEHVKYSEARRQILEMVPPGGNWRSLPEEVAKSYMKKTYKNGGGNTGVARRLSWDKPCYTLVCSPSQKTSEFCHPDETRPLTVRESARIQTFPDDWEFCGTVREQYAQIGNAVAVQFAKELGDSIIEFLYQTV